MIEFTKEHQLESIIKKEKLVLVDFFATWCGPCQMIMPILDEISKTTKFPIYKIDIDQFKSIAETHQIRSVPTLVLFKDGQEIDRRLGFQPKQQLETWLASHQK